jgi:dihydrofolate reductase
MKRLRYSVAASLDGFIAASDGSYDWIINDPAIDFVGLFKQFDTFVMGRGTFEITLTHQGEGNPTPGARTIVFSTTLRQEDYPKVTIVATDPAATVRALKAESGKDIWLFGGGILFRSLLDAGLVDTVEVAVIPIVLGGGIPLVAPGRRSPVLRLTDHKVMPSGIVMLSYDVPAASARGKRSIAPQEGDIQLGR